MPKNTNTNKTRSRSPLKLYFLLMTLTGVIGSLISLGILIFSVAKKVIITDQEYIISERYYELDSCNSPVLKPSYADKPIPNTSPSQVSVNYAEAYTTPTDAEKEKCKAEKTTQLIQSRQATFKMDVLNWAIRSILFLVLLMTHYFKFMRTRKED